MKYILNCTVAQQINICYLKNNIGTKAGKICEVSQPASRLSPFTHSLIRATPSTESCSARQGGCRRLSMKTMTKIEKQPTRKHGTHLRVPVLAHEKSAIRHHADAAGLSVAAYLRNIGLGHEVPSVLDYRRVEDLAKINGDLGRLGGLLKLWLTNDERLRQVKVEEIRGVLSKIERNQDAMRAIMQRVLSR